MATAPSPARPVIVVRRRRRVASVHHGGAWKVAYADFVTAMMAFFMLLWLMSNPDKQRLKGLAQYFTPASAIALSQAADASDSVDRVNAMAGAGGPGRRGQTESAPVATGQPATTANTVGVRRGASASIPDASLRVLAQELRVAIDRLPPDDDGRRAMRIEEDRDGLRISLMDTEARSMFRSGTATINPYGRELLAHVAQKLLASSAQVAIEGHTDGSGGDGWRLSAERALAARSAMIVAGLAPGRFAEMVALADTRPVYPDQPDRPENRRITIVAKGAAAALPAVASFRF